MTGALVDDAPARGVFRLARPRRVPIAWLAIIQNRVRTAAAIAGIAFALVFIFMQLGFYAAVVYTAGAVTNGLDFDILLVSKDYLHLQSTGSFPRRRLSQAAALREVKSAVPLYLSMATWRERGSRSRADVLVLGLHATDPVLVVPGAAGVAAALTKPASVVCDRLDLPLCGRTDPGTEVQLEDLKLTVAAQVTLGVGFLTNGLALVADTTFARAFSASLDDVHLGLVKLEPGASADGVAAALRGRLQDDVAVLTRAEIDARQLRYWIGESPAGKIFGFGALLAFTVGVIVLYQILSTDVVKRLPEYATLRALGYPDGRVYGVILEQAVLLAVLGYVPAVLTALLLYAGTEAATNLPMPMPPSRAAAVLVASLVMCTMAGALATRKVARADPADLF